MAENTEENPPNLMLSPELCAAVDDIGKTLQSCGELGLPGDILDASEQRTQVIQYLVNSMQQVFKRRLPTENLSEDISDNTIADNSTTVASQNNTDVNEPTVEVDPNELKHGGLDDGTNGESKEVIELHTIESVHYLPDSNEIDVNVVEIPFDRPSDGLDAEVDGSDNKASIADTFLSSNGNSIASTSSDNNAVTAINNENVISANFKSNNRSFQFLLQSGSSSPTKVEPDLNNQSDDSIENDMKESENEEDDNSELDYIKQYDEINKLPDTAVVSSIKKEESENAMVNVLISNGDEGVMSMINSDMPQLVTESNVKEALKRGLNIDEVYQCFHCGKCFNKKHSFQIHSKIHTDPFKCTQCDKVFAQKSHLKEHLRTHTGERPYQCNYCDKTFTFSAALTSHHRTHTGEKPFKCSKCDKCFAQSSGLATHLISHEGAKKRFFCSVCGRGYAAKSDLDNHERLNCGTIKEFLCDECGKSFNNRTSLKVHILTHKAPKGNKRKNICTTCGKTFSYESHYENHLKTHEEGYVANKKEFIPRPKDKLCDECGKGFASVKQLEVHQRKHEDEKLLGPLVVFDRKVNKTQVNKTQEPTKTRVYPCGVCKKEFKSSGHLSDHVKIHSGEKPHICTTCGKSFIQRSSLKRHQRTHTGEKSFLCGQCGKAFRAPEHLRYHLMMHANVKPFKCITCGNGFRSKSSLKKHQLVHETSEKQFACEFCGKHFKRKESLKYHTKAHFYEPKISTETFVCGICPKVFSWKCSYVKHLKKHGLSMKKDESEDLICQVASNTAS